MYNSEFFDAVTSDDVQTLDKFLATVKDPTHLNTTGFDGNAAAIVAVKNGYSKSLRLLIKHANKLNIVLAELNTAAMYAMCAIENGHTECLRLLIDADAELNVQDSNNKTAAMLRFAASGGHTESLRLLIAHTKINIPPKVFNDAALCALQNKHIGCFGLLIAHTKINIPAKCFGGAVIEAAKIGNANILEILLAHPVSSQISAAYLGAALQEAARNKSTCFALLIQFVIQHPGQLKIPAKYFGEALKNTITSNNPGGLSLLIKHAEQLKIPPNCFSDAALLAISNDYISCAEVLIEANRVDLNAQEDITGMTATMFAALNGNYLSLPLLIKRNADLNITNTHGKTAISLAAEKGKVRCIALLLAADVVVSKEDIKLLKHYDVVVSKEDIKLLKHYKVDLFGILANDFVHMFGEDKSNRALLKAFLNKDSALHKVFSAPIGLTACSRESGTLGQIRDVLLERKLIKRRVITSASLPHTTHFKSDRRAAQQQPKDPYDGKRPIFNL